MDQKERKAVKENLYQFSHPDMSDLKLLGSECLNCREKYFQIKPICPNCSMRNLKKILLSDTGRIETYTIVRQTNTGWRGPVPYIIAVVKLDDGVEVTSHLIECEQEDIKIGARVVVVAGKLRERKDGTEVIAHMFKLI